MNRNPIKLPPADSELVRLVELMCDGAISPAERDRLELLLENDRDAKLFYIAYLDLHAQMQWMMREDRAEEVASGQWSVAGESDMKSLNPEISKSQIPNLPPAVSIILDDSTLPAPLSSLPFYISHPFVFSNLFALLVIGIGALGAWFYQVDIPHPVARSGRSSINTNKSLGSKELEFVGRVTGMVDVKWADINTSTETGNGVPLGRKYALSSGLMEITYHTGAKVILQGPVTYEVDSRDGGFLSIGKLTAKLEKRGEGRGESQEKRSEVRGQGSEKVASGQQLVASGRWSVASEENPKSQISNPQSHVPVFAVQTPTAVVTDLGTEFGVEVDKNGTTTSYVFQGTVKFAAVKDGVEDESNAVVLNKDESIRAEKLQNTKKMSIILSRVNVDQKSFARRLVGPLQVIDLLDIVAGGTGRGNLRERGIDPTTGMEDPLFASSRLTSDSRYRPITWGRGLIDGVFVPNGKDGPVQLDSAGHFFDQFPATSGMTWGSIWPRTADLKRVPFSLTEQMKTSDYWIYSMGSGRQYMPKRLGLLALHPNVGITFNLDAIRKLHRSERPARFRALAAVAIPEKSQLDWQRSRSDIWVFVDGQLKLNKMRLEDKDAPVSLDIALGPHDHFLTLVGTDGGDTQAWDLLILGDPLLEMLPTGNDDATNSEFIKTDLYQPQKKR